MLRKALIKGFVLWFCVTNLFADDTYIDEAKQINLKNTELIEDVGLKSLEKRVEALENILKNQLTIETLKQISVLQEEVMELRGIIEVQDHNLSILQSKQKEVFEKGNTLSSKEDNSEESNKSKSEKEQYQFAYKLVQKKQYSSAVRALQEFVEKFPNSEHYVHAQYWLGDIYLTEWQFNKDNELLSEKAKHCFSEIVAKYPTSTKVPDALLKLGVIAEEAGNWRLAANYLQDVKQHYPNSTSARIAHVRLQKMEQEGLL